MINFNENRFAFLSINSRFKNSDSHQVIVTKHEWTMAHSFLFSKKRQNSFLFIAKSAFFSFFSLRSNKHTKEALERVERKFTSLNSVDVERSTITLKEWNLVCSHTL